MTTRTRVAAALLSAIVAASGCTAETTTAAEPTTTTISAATAAASQSLDDVSAQIISAWDQYQSDQESGRFAFAEDQLAGASEFEAIQNISRLEVASTLAALDALPVSVHDPDIDAPLQDLRSNLSRLVEVTEQMVAAGEAGPEAAEAEVEAAFSGELVASEYVDLLFEGEDSFNSVSESCFGLQEALTSAGLGLLDCTGANVDGDEIQADAVADVDPTTEATGTAFARLEAGNHDFELFGPGLTLDIASPIQVRTSSENVDLQPLDGPNLTVTILAMDRATVPGVLHSDASQMSFAPVPEDIEVWLGELPLNVLGTGAIQLGPDVGTYWDLEVDEDRLPAELGWPSFLTLAVFAGEPTDSAFGTIGFIPVPGSSLRLIEWRRSTRGDRLFLSWLNDGTMDVPTAEAFLEEVLAGAS